MATGLNTVSTLARRLLRPATRPLLRRVHVARDNGADVFLSFHFNDFTENDWNHPRGTETYYDSTGNVALSEDQNFATRINTAVYNTIARHDTGAINRGVKGQGLDVLSDPSLGNSASYHPVRAVLLEMEFIDNLAVDRLLNLGANHDEVRQNIVDAIIDAIQDDLLHNP